MKISTLPTTLKFYLIYSLILLVTGITKTEMIINAGSKTYESVIRISSYISIPIMIITVFVLLIAQFGLVWFILQLHKINITIDDFVYSIRYFIFGIAAGEIVKFSCVFIFFTDELKVIGSEITEVSLRKTFFYEISNYIDIFSCMIGSGLFGYCIENILGYSINVSILAILYSIIVMISVYLIFTI